MKHDTRQKRAREIEAAAYAILEREGFGGFSVQAVAREARASNETIYRWYGNRTGLFEALIRGNAAEVEAVIWTATDSPAIERLVEVGTVLLAMLLGPRAIALNRAAAADTSGTLGRALAREGRETVAPRVVALMREARENGDLSGSPEELAEAWFGLLIGDLQIRCVTRALPRPRPEYIDARAAQARDRLTRLFPPQRLDAAGQTS